jgi:hypothetical protein
MDEIDYVFSVAATATLKNRSRRALELKWISGEGEKSGTEWN